MPDAKLKKESLDKNGKKACKIDTEIINFIEKRFI